MTIEHPDHAPYRHFTKRQRVDKAIQTLGGLLQGVAIDNELNAAEIAEIVNWCNEYRELIGNAPFDELIPKLDQILEDGIVDPEEQDELLWVCKNLAPESEFYDDITHDIQRLHGILHGILADDHISTVEAKQLQEWIDDHSHLKGTYPYDELDSLLMTILADGVVDAEEQKLLRAFFENFIEYSFAKKVRQESARVREGLPKEFTLPGVCASCPEISFDGRTFTFTGTSMRGKRRELADSVAELGGEFSPNLTKQTEFLVIGAAGNPCWAFSCYGRKVEKAVELRKDGHAIIIVHETDFWDAVEDHKC
jgi:NAD-dependent DNA ligase